MRKKLRYIRILLSFALSVAGVLLLVACNTTNTVKSGADNNLVAVTTEAQDIQSTVPLDMLELSLPNEGVIRRDSEDRETFVIDDIDAGGVFLLNVDSAVFDDVLNYQESVTPLVLTSMKNMNNLEWEWYTSSSSFYSLFEVNMGCNQEEYIAYVVRGYTACYIVWFDRSKISIDDEIAIMQSLTSSDISADLNTVSSQAYADAIAESMAQEEYQFELTPPEAICFQNETPDGALFYQNGKLVGGYKIIHFEKGILPAASENQDLIVNRLKEYLSDQVDLSNFSGEINDEGLITVQFSGDGVVYTHYILSYGQVGTQYDIWFDESQVEQNTINTIIDSAQLLQIS